MDGDFTAASLEGFCGKLDEDFSCFGFPSDVGLGDFKEDSDGFNDFIEGELSDDLCTEFEGDLTAGFWPVPDGDFIDAPECFGSESFLIFTGGTPCNDFCEFCEDPAGLPAIPLDDLLELLLGTL